MSTDNTLLNPGVGGDTVRDLARQGGSVKTQAVQLDLGGGSANAEVLITAGQQVMSASVPVVMASNQPAITIADGNNPYRGASSYFASSSGTAVVPSGARIVSLSAHSVTGGTISIFGGASIPVPANNGFSDGYSGFIGPGNIIFTGTDSYYVVVNQ